MNKFPLKILLLLNLLLFLNFPNTKGQANLRFTNLTVDDGLSQTTANAIMQDKKGFLWFGTQDGLNRYDGYTFKIYSSEAGNKNSLSNNYIWSVYEDNQGIFWIGTFGGGLTRFDPVNETYSHFKNDPGNKNSLSSNDIFKIVEYPEGTLWLRTGNGINKFDKKNKKITRFLNKTINRNDRNNFYISALEIQAPDLIWAGTDSGLVKLNIRTGKHHFFTSDPLKNQYKFGIIYSLFLNEKDLFICCDSGLIKLDFSNNTVSKIPLPSTIDNKQITARHVLIDGDYFWIGTSNGLILHHTKKNTFHHYVHNSNDPNSLTHNNIVSLYKSREGIIWIGTSGGINKIDKLVPDFDLIQYDANKRNSLSHKSIGPIIEDRNGILWIGTPDGLNAYNRSSGENIIFRKNANKKNSLSSNYILSLLEDRKGNIWVGTRDNGLNKFSYNSVSEINNISFEKILWNDPFQTSKRIQSLYEDKVGIIWIGTGGRGIVKFNPENEEFILYPPSLDGTGPSHSYGYCMFEDSENNFWIGTPTGGLNLLDRKSGKFIYFKNNVDDPSTISNDIILSIHQDSKKQLWLGTSGGLNKLNTKIQENMFEKINNSLLKISFTRYGRKQGLPNEVIYGILVQRTPNGEDANGFFWFSTNKGLVKFDPSSENPVVKAFDVKDGLQNNEFNQNSFFMNKNGEMYFGGIGGFNIFHPDSIKLNQYKPPVVFTDFKLFNETVPVNREDIYSLPQSLSAIDEINLSYKHDVISFEFAALNFVNPEKNQYEYMMGGFDKNWIYSGNRRLVTYTNLDPGSYIFKVKASNNDGIWNEQGASIVINIPPPPWLSWYAYLIYASLFFFIIILFIKYRVREATREIEMQSKIERAKIEEREEVRKKSSADFHDEAGNKITKISLFTELAKTEADKPSLKGYLEKIEENLSELSAGMRDFIWVLDPNKDSLYDSIVRLQDFGNSMFGYTNINFHIKGLTPEMKNRILSMDCRRAIVLIFKEAMNNCFKYSCASNVEMIIEIQDNLIEFSLKDDGKGFDSSNLSNGYGLKNMKERAEKIGCSFQIDSEQGLGTKITLKGNIAHMGN